MEYVVAIKTVRGKCKKDRRYKILDIQNIGDILTFGDIEAVCSYSAYLITHNSKMVYVDTKHFISEIKYHRKLKLRKLNEIVS